MDTHTRRGFTLVELAVVITIVGLLIGAVIQTQNMIWEGRVTATLAQVEAYRGAVTTFREIYTDLPGDMDGEKRIENCNENCKPRGTGFIGDGYVGNSWGAHVWEFRDEGLGGSSSADGENALFWMHLYKAGLITDVNGALLDNPDLKFRWGVTHPSAAIGGGFIVKHPRSHERTTGAPFATAGIQGLVIGIAKYPYRAPGTTGGLDQKDPGANMMRSLVAEAVDKKGDDGYPAYGLIQAYGTGNSCFEGESGLPGGYRYWPKADTKDCSLIFKLFR